MEKTKFSALLLATTVLSAPAGLAYAQAPAAAEVEQIVVTGSRLQSAGFTAPTPLTAIGAAQIEQRAPTGIAEVLNELPSFRSSSGSNQSQRLLIGIGAGQSTSDLRGLGSTRTLTLVNGRRFVGQNSGGSIDTQVIPAGLVERVDVVTGGASAAYGSDAVAGVVNYILKTRMEGFSGTIQAGVSQYNDNKEYGLTLSGGRKFLDDRAHIVVGIDYNNNKGVGTIYERKRTSIEPGNTASPIPFTGANRPAGVPAAGWLPTVQFASMTKGGVITGARTAAGASVTALNFLAFGEGGSTYQMERGRVYGNLMQGVSSNVGPLSNWGLRTPNNRGTGMAILTYELTENTKATFEATYARTEIDGFSSFHTQPTVTILRNNPFIPTAIQTRMDQLGVTQIDIGRVDTEWGGAQTHNIFDTYRFAAALDGQFANGWVWDAYIQHGLTEGWSSLYHTRESNLQAAQYAVMGPNGTPVCGPIATNPNMTAARQSASIRPEFVLPGCVPFNPFGVGSASKEAIDYVSGDQITNLFIRQTVAAANIAGDIFDLPAGPVSAAAGVEYREDSLKQKVDALQEMGIYTNGNSKAWRGANKVAEGFVEFGVPLARDLAFAKSLDLNGAVRRTHYENSGWVTTWKVGVSYEPTDFLRLRATQSRDIRAPNLNDLFFVGGTSTGAQMSVNPFNNQLGRIAGSSEGNPDLKPEIADSFTAGVVFQPQWGWSQGLRASVDYYKIELNEVIAPASDILRRCFEGLTEYCNLIEFDNSPFGIRRVLNRPLNQAALNTNGVDIEVAYRVPIEAISLPGRFDVRVLANWTDDLERIDRAGTTITTVDYAGSSQSGGKSEWTGTINANYALDDFSAGLQVRLFSELMYDVRRKAPGDEDYNPADVNSINDNKFPSIPYFTLNMAQGFDLDGHRMQVFGVVSNLFDRQAPILSIAALNSGGNPYDYIGRSFKVGLRFNW